jgi:hypothetical protein
MPLKIVSVPVEKTVTMLEDAEVSFISLVRHGANRMPFRVMKADVEKGGPGSGHFGHAGRPGHRGGSADDDGMHGDQSDLHTHNNTGAIYKQHEKIAKKLLGSTVKADSDGFTWSKNGGHPDSALKRMRANIEAAGFKEFSSDSADHPAGDWTSLIELTRTMLEM